MVRTHIAAYLIIAVRVTIDANRFALISIIWRGLLACARPLAQLLCSDRLPRGSCRMCRALGRVASAFDKRFSAHIFKARLELACIALALLRLRKRTR